MFGMDDLTSVNMGLIFPVPGEHASRPLSAFNNSAFISYMLLCSCFHIIYLSSRVRAFILCYRVRELPCKWGCSDK